MTDSRAERGVADIIGAIVLVSVVTLGIAIAAATVISHPVPQRMPALSIDVANTTKTVYLTHAGGDTLHGGEFRILADGLDKTSSITKRGGPVGDWSVGETLEYTPSDGTMPSAFQIVSLAGSPQVIVQVQV